MNIEQEKMIVESLSSIYPMQKFEEDAIKVVLDALPSAEPKRGRWIYSSYDDESGFDESWECDKCGYTTNIEETNFCPNCGADMRGD